MRQLVSALFFAAVFNSTSLAAPAQRIHLQPEQASSISADQQTFDFQLIDDSQEKILSEDDLLRDSNRQLAMIAFDAGLIEFQHLTPIYDSERWSANVHFSRAGKYQIWLQGTLANENLPFQTITPLTVTGGLPENPAPPHFKEQRTATDSNATITLAPTGIRAEQLTLLKATLSHSGDSKPFANLGSSAPPFAVAVSTSGLDVRLLEIEPGADAEHFTLKVLLPKPASYRLWIEVTENGQVRRFPLVLLANR